MWVPPDDYRYIVAALLRTSAAEVTDEQVANVAAECEVVAAEPRAEEIEYLVRWRGSEWVVPVPRSLDE